MAKTLRKQRILVIAILLFVGYGTLGYRLVDLQVLNHARLRQQAQSNTQQTILRSSRRGEIRDRHGNLLAGSVFVKTLSANPVLIGPHRLDLARVLAPLLEMPEEELADKLRIRTYVTKQGELKEDPHVYLKHKVPFEIWELVQNALRSFKKEGEETLPREERTFLRNLRAGAIFAEPYDDQLRVYPNKSLAAHLLGFVGIIERETVLGPVRDIAGADGLELTLNPILTGVGGWRTTEVVRKHELIPFRDQNVEPQAGRTVILTLDAGLQHILEAEIAGVMEKHSPVSVSAVAVRPRTGEILALANLPTFDPNRPGDATPDHRRNRCITDMAEPGSTFKIVAVSGALNENIVNLETRFDCENGRFFFAGRYLKDDHPAGILSVAGIVAKSSNIGTAKIAMQLGPERFYEYILRFGFGTATGLPLPGEALGIVHPTKKWSKISISRIPIGQGIAVTPLQMVMAMSAVANQGRLMQPMLIDRVQDEEGRIVVQYAPQVVRQIVREETAASMVQALQSVVSTNGTARRARLEFYSAAGKTGTAQKPGPGGYMAGEYFSSFVGFFPSERPELCIGVFLDRPKLPFYYGGVTAAPAFKNIAERAAKYMAIKPDFLPSESLAPEPASPRLTAARNRP